MQKVSWIVPLLCASAVALTVMWPVGAVLAAAPAFKVPAGERQLFLDDVGIAKIENLKRSIHQPDKQGALIRPNKFIGEEAVQVRGAPAWDPKEKLFKIWLSGTKNRYRTSPDGLHWTSVPYPGSGLGSTAMVYDPNETDPARRFKAPLPNSGFAVSPDGVHWTKLDVPPVQSLDENNFSYNPKEGLFIHTVKRGGPYGRSVGLATSRDFEKWHDYGVVFHADAKDQELGRKLIKARFADPTMHHPCYDIPSTYNVDVYNMGVFRYESLYIGLPMMYYKTGQVPGSWPGFDKLPISEAMLVNYRRDGDWAGFHDVQLTSSRNLKDWKRLANREPFMIASPLGAGAWDEASPVPPSYPVLREEELWFYNTVCRYYGVVLLEHGRNKPNTAISLSTLRRDGFMSLDAGEQAGMILTEVFALPGTKLFVNVNAFRGKLLVEVLDRNGKVLAASIPMTGDLLHEQVVWKTGDLAALKGEAVSMRFSLRNASLYSYWVE